MYVDALSYLAELVGFYCLLSRREALFGLTLAIGILNRETVLLLGPVYLLELRAAGRLGRADLPRVALVLGAPIAVFGLLVVLKLAVAGEPSAALAALPPNPRAFVHSVPTLQVLADVYSVFGLSWLLAALNVRAAPPLIRRGLSYGLLVVLQLAVVRGDEGRILSHLVPLVIPLAVLELRRYARAPGLGVLLVAAGLTSAVNFRLTLIASAALRYALVGAGTLVGLVITLVARRSCAAPRLK
jgi:hypothetical protein